jgi:uncharacterized protein YaaR (DUF327 family)
VSPLKEVGKQIAKSLVRGLGEAPMPAKPFYSPLDKAISEITQTKGTGQQIEQILKKTKGVSKELKDRPVIQDLLKQPKVTKEQLEKAAVEHPAAQVTEKVEKGPSETGYRVEHDELNDSFDVVDDYGDAVKSFRNYDDAESYAGKLQGGTTQYEEYQLPGGKNYREVKLMLPTQPKKETWEWFDPITQESSQGFATQQAAYDARPNISAVVAKVEAKDSSQSFQSSHFEEPNVLAHARVSDRVGPNGEKILHVEEIQSDWHQKGRKHGYQLPTNEREALYKRRVEIESYGMNATPEQKQEWADVMNRLQPETQHKKVPEAPFKQNWHELVMKRLLDDAARNGYDKVVITPGIEQVKRYPEAMRNIADEIVWNAADSETKMITMRKNGFSVFSAQIDKNGDVIRSETPQAIGKNLDELIGKNMAQQAIENPSGEIKGKDFTVGGKGMEGFYDQILPSYLNEYGKKYGSKVDLMKLPTPPKNSMDVQGYPLGDEYIQGAKTWDEFIAANPRAMEEFYTPVHSFDITPQMREEITGKGQPLYQAIPAGVGAGTLAAPQEEVPEQPMKKGGAVGMDAMRLAVMNKQLRKRHG